MYKEISDSEMNAVYERIKTPFKCGAVIKLGDYLTDSPSVFRYNGSWYMYYIRIAKDVKTAGYETYIAKSDDLLNWKTIGKMLARSTPGKWDSLQTAGYAAFVDMKLGGTNELLKVNGKYHMTYLGGCADGYEPDPMMMGQAYSDNPVEPMSFTRMDNPVLSPLDKDARKYERVTVYKGNMLEDEARTLGHRFINSYNAKDETNSERIYMAVSDDGEHWQRCGEEPLIDEVGKIDGLAISGDPQIVKIGDIYVMIYYRCIGFKTAYDTFACSRDLIHWRTWDGEPLVKCEYEWENLFAHKPCVLEHDGVVYHFYCAVNDKGERFIALAASKKLRDPQTDVTEKSFE